MVGVSGFTGNLGHTSLVEVKYNVLSTIPQAFPLKKKTDLELQ